MVKNVLSHTEGLILHFWYLQNCHSSLGVLENNDVLLQ